MYRIQIGGDFMNHIFLKEISRKVVLKRKKPFYEKVVVRRAVLEDMPGIYHVAASVGNDTQEPYDGFLMDDYTSNPNFYKERFNNWINKLEFFYVAEVKNQIVGFLMAFTKDEWLEENPDWINHIHWQPNFNCDLLNHFVLTDKIAILSGYTALGIGSQIYESYLSDLNDAKFENIFSETIVGPVPNFASLSFRIKQKFSLVGVRFENYKDFLYTDLIYHRKV